MSIRIRQATPEDIPVLAKLIDASVRGLHSPDYTPSQIEAALRTVYGVDSQLIADGTYFVVQVEDREEPSGLAIVGCGGWSKRKTLFGADHWNNRHDDLLDPQRDAAKIRAFFVHPSWARRGVGSLILETSERAAQSAGFTRLEMGATLSGVPFYRAKGYSALENLEVPLSHGESLPIVRMAKRL
jgi:GNAT superfamily N-acetyltransferase